MMLYIRAVIVALLVVSLAYGLGQIISYLIA